MPEPDRPQKPSSQAARKGWARKGRSESDVSGDRMNGFLLIYLLVILGVIVIASRMAS